VELESKRFLEQGKDYVRKAKEATGRHQKKKRVGRDPINVPLEVCPQGDGSQCEKSLRDAQ
jgi:hypothetical protein